MSTHANPDNTEPDFNGAPSTPDDEHWWPRLVDHINDWWMHGRPTWPALRHALRIPPKRGTAAILATLTLVVAVAAGLVWAILAGLLSLIGWIERGIRHSVSHAGHHGAHRLAGWPLTRTITQPVHAYLTQHAAGLPVSGHALWLAWLAITLGVFVLAVAGSRGARLAWIIVGAATTAMVYAGTIPHARHLAAGLALTLWAVLCIPAYNRLFPADPPVHLAIRLPRRPRPDTD